jgi:hypothetical protein
VWIGETMPQGRYTFLGAQPAVEVLAQGHTVTVLDHQKASRVTTVIKLLDTLLGLLTSQRRVALGRGQGHHNAYGRFSTHLGESVKGQTGVQALMDVDRRWRMIRCKCPRT